MEHLLYYLKFRFHSGYYLGHLEYHFSFSTTLRVVLHSTSEVLSDTDIIDYQSSWLISIHSIYTSYCLHQIRSLHLLVDVHRVKARNIKTRKPHGLNYHDLQFIIHIFESGSEHFSVLLTRMMRLKTLRIIR